jgi:hypothetical protein
MIKFLVFLFFGLVTPGFLIVSKIKCKDYLLNIFLSITTGFVFLTLVAFIAGYFDARWVTTVFILVANFLFLWKKQYLYLLKPLQKVSLIRSSFYKYWWVIVLIALGVVFQNVAMFRSGIIYDFGVGFWGPLGHDGISHQALANQLIKNIPPNNPVLSGETLRNYHYFSDLLVAETYRLTKISVSDLIYRYYPVLFSILLGFGSFYLSRNVLRRKLSIALSLFLVYFGGSFGWIVEWFKYGTLGGESAFWVNQPVSMNLNPPFAISLVLLIAIVILFGMFVKDKTKGKLFLIALLAGTLIEFKVYAGIIALSSLFGISVFAGLLKKDFDYLKLFLLSFVISLVVFLPQNSGSVGLVEFSPFWFIHSMIDFPDRVGWLKLSQARIAYTQEGKLIRLFAAEVLALLIFIIGNLGTRIAAMIGVIYVWKKKKFNASRELFIILLLASSFIAPLLFVQKGNPWNTIQFMYYFLYFSALLAGVGLFLVVKRLGKAFSLTLLVSFVLITPISSFATFRSGFYPDPPTAVSIDEIMALSFLKDRKDGVVLTPPHIAALRGNYSTPYPISVYETSAYVSAFSGKEVYVADLIQQEILQTAYHQRYENTYDFYYKSDSAWKNDFLKRNNIDYVYLQKLFGVELDERSINIKKIFENQEVVI